MNILPEKIALTTQQIGAIEPQHDGLPRRQIISASAGSGKTTTLAERIKWILNSPGVRAGHIIACTFTRAGGTALQQRVSGQLLWSGTLHGLAVRELGVSPETICTEAEADEFIRNAIEVQRLKSVTLKAARAAITKPGDQFGDMGLLLRTLKRDLDRAGRTTFDFILREFLEQDVCGLRPKWLIVDEAQDTSPMDAAIYRKLSEHGNLIVAGDINQAIYGFRGANAAFMLNLQRDAALCADAGLHTVETPLTVSFRCAPKICWHATELLRAGSTEWQPAMVSSVKGTEGKVARAHFATERPEEDWLIDWAKSHSDGSTAILGRYNVGVDRMRRAFQSAGVRIQPRSSAASDKTEEGLTRVLRHLVAGEYIEAASYAADPSTLHGRWPDFGRFVEALLKPARHPLEHDAVLQGQLLMLELPAEMIRHPAAQRPNAAAALEWLQDSGGRTVDDDSGIHIETIHGVKGREFDRVALFACDDGIDGDNPGDQARNLFYVAMTRARSEFVATWSTETIDFSGASRQNRRPSRYISEAKITAGY